MASRTRFTLVKDAREDDPKSAFERHYRESYPLVFNYVFRCVGNRTTAEDVTADAFLRAARNFESFDASRAKFSTWVISIARNCIGTHYRRERPTADIDDVAETLYATNEDPQAILEDRTDTNIAARLFAELDDESRELVFKKYYENKQNKQIALEMHMNASTVSTKLSRILAKMRAVAKREGL